MTGTALFHDGHGTLFHFNGMEAAGMWANLALVLRTSTDNGVTWSAPRLINAAHQPRNQVISGTLVTREGVMLQPCDAVHGGNGGTAIHISHDRGRTWIDPGTDTPKPDYQNNGPGGTIAGIHAGVVELTDGRLLAFGRGDNRHGATDNIDGLMPMSISSDLGRSWHYSASPFPPLTGGQRLVLRRLQEGPILFCSFTDPSKDLKNPVGMRVIDGTGRENTGFGLFAALSFDDGDTWPMRRLVTPIADAAAADAVNGGAWTGEFTLDATHAEPRGYMAATQTPDGMVHLISSALHYRFNLAWLMVGR